MRGSLGVGLNKFGAHLTSEIGTIFFYGLGDGGSGAIHSLIALWGPGGRWPAFLSPILGVSPNLTRRFFTEIIGARIIPSKPVERVGVVRLILTQWFIELMVRFSGRSIWETCGGGGSVRIGLVLSKV